MMMDLQLKGENGRDQTVSAPTWILHDLTPAPTEEWDRLRDFLNLTRAERRAMLSTVEILFQRGHELVVANYDYLLSRHDTAAILGWDKGADPEHLAERRRFFTVWLARTLGMDFSHDFARYLFRAGQIHAAHGPREIHVPERYVTGAISLVNATFARFLNEERPGHPQTPAALAGWNKVLTLHLHMMLQGYQTARAWDSGEFEVEIALFGKMRSLAGEEKRSISLSPGDDVARLLAKFFNYYPQTRSEVFEIAWQEGERIDETGTPWLTVDKSYRVKRGWRVLRNGRHLGYSGGLSQPLEGGDVISIFPPGR